MDVYVQSILHILKRFFTIKKDNCINTFLVMITVTAMPINISKKAFSAQHGALWETSENVDKCRGCALSFALPLLKWKHHCSVCAGVFCAFCCQVPISSPRSISKMGAGMTSMKICNGCKRGEAPGETLRNKIRQQIEDDAKEAAKKIREQEEKDAEKGLTQQEIRERR
jgi:hypothetical protein